MKMRSLRTLGLGLMAAVAIMVAPAWGDYTYRSQFGTYGSDNGQFYTPTGVAFDGSGNVYIVDGANNRVEKFTSGVVFLRTFDTGNGPFNAPRGVAVDGAGNVFVADTNNNRIAEFTSAGVFVTTFGTIGTGNGRFKGPEALAVDGAGSVFVADTGNNRIEVFAPAAVPEPSSLVLAVVGVTLAGVWAQERCRA